MRLHSTGKSQGNTFIHNHLPFRYLQRLTSGLLCNVVKHDETLRDVMQQEIMPVLIEGIAYFSVEEIAKDLGVSRSTFWRWRALSEELPTGRRYRGKMVVFTKEEVEAIRGFANRLEPVRRSNRAQMKLFNGNK
jgi:predicted DNA-binding transcriptional regulator AlpA